MAPRARDFGFGAWADCFGPRLFAFAGGRSGFRFKIFDRGDLKYVVLSLVAERPMHGYEVMRALEEESGGCYSASPGSVYPTLQWLEDMGYVAAEEEDGKKVYRITDAGREFLEENGDVVDEIAERISRFTDRFFGDEMRDLTRSFRDLARETFEGAMRGPEDAEGLARMKEVLDRAARQMKQARAGGPDEL
jgi:DNA-binding PadR family transcriptional regulator